MSQECMNLLLLLSISISDILQSILLIMQQDNVNNEKIIMKK